MYTTKIKMYTTENFISPLREDFNQTYKAVFWCQFTSLKMPTCDIPEEKH